jgi:DtxR family transcriptional regulator, Mn-dependent transcriptional regulator
MLIRRIRSTRLRGKAMSEQEIDEILEGIWIRKEEGGEETCGTPRDPLGIPENHASIQEMAGKGLIQVAGEKVEFTEAGFKRARRIIRRHRLAERLLHDILEIDHREMETQACEFEHILSTGVAESICTLLGHPPTCPHGKPIPQGECCKRDEKTLRPLITPLSDLPVGGEGRIVFIRPRDPATLQRLGALGVLPGISVQVHQKSPALVIEVGETTVAVDEEFAREIYVKSRPDPKTGERRPMRKGWRGWFRQEGGRRPRRRRWDGRT